MPDSRFQGLFTKDNSKKRKVWHDCEIILNSSAKVLRVNETESVEKRKIFNGRIDDDKIKVIKNFDMVDIGALLIMATNPNLENSNLTTPIDNSSFKYPLRSILSRPLTALKPKVEKEERMTRSQKSDYLPSISKLLVEKYFMDYSKHVFITSSFNDIEEYKFSLTSLVLDELTEVIIKSMITMESNVSKSILEHNKENSYGGDRVSSKTLVDSTKGFRSLKAFKPPTSMMSRESVVSKVLATLQQESILRYVSNLQLIVSPPRAMDNNVDEGNDRNRREMSSDHRRYGGNKNFKRKAVADEDQEEQKLDSGDIENTDEVNDPNTKLYFKFDMSQSPSIFGNSFPCPHVLPTIMISVGC